MIGFDFIFYGPLIINLTQLLKKSKENCDLPYIIFNVWHIQHTTCIILLFVTFACTLKSACRNFFIKTSVFI